MNSVSKLQLTNFRNFAEVSIQPCPGLNLIHGENGSGKTSLLEALYVLSTGKSFRSSLVDPLVKNEEAGATLFVQTSDQARIGLCKPRNQKHQLRLNEENQKNWDQVARLLPTQVLDSNSFQLIEGGPKARRRFLDWGVFHVEPSFIDHWRRTNKCIANRNRLLKLNAPDTSQFVAWEQELASAGAEVNRARQSYLDQLLPIFEETYSALVGEHPDLSLAYRRGWPDDATLLETLAEHRENERRYGSSQYGPHRADLEIKMGKRKAVEILSRGQQKLLVCALKIAQGQLLSQAVSNRCIYLIDDLPAELDRTNRQKVLKQLAALGTQLFVTSVEEKALELEDLAPLDIAKFHVERGTITG